MESADHNRRPAHRSRRHAQHSRRHAHRNPRLVRLSQGHDRRNLLSDRSWNVITTPANTARTARRITNNARRRGDAGSIN